MTDRPINVPISLKADDQASRVVKTAVDTMVRDLSRLQVSMQKTLASSLQSASSFGSSSTLPSSLGGHPQATGALGSGSHVAGLSSPSSGLPGHASLPALGGSSLSVTQVLGADFHQKMSAAFQQVVAAALSQVQQTAAQVTQQALTQGSQGTSSPSSGPLTPSGASTSAAAAAYVYDPAGRSYSNVRSIRNLPRGAASQLGPGEYYQANNISGNVSIASTPVLPQSRLQRIGASLFGAAGRDPLPSGSRVAGLDNSWVAGPGGTSYYQTPLPGSSQGFFNRLFQSTNQQRQTGGDEFQQADRRYNYGAGFFGQPGASRRAITSALGIGFGVETLGNELSKGIDSGLTHTKDLGDVRKIAGVFGSPAQYFQKSVLSTGNGLGYSYDDITQLATDYSSVTGRISSSKILGPVGRDFNSQGMVAPPRPTVPGWDNIDLGHGPKQAISGIAGDIKSVINNGDKIKSEFADQIGFWTKSWTDALPPTQTVKAVGENFSQQLKNIEQFATGMGITAQVAGDISGQATQAGIINSTDSGINQKQLMAAMADASEQGGMSGRIQELATEMQSVMTNIESKLVVAPNANAVLGEISQLGSSGQRGLQGARGAQILNDVNSNIQTMGSGSPGANVFLYEAIQQGQKKRTGKTLSGAEIYLQAEQGIGDPNNLTDAMNYALQYTGGVLPSAKTGAAGANAAMVFEKGLGTSSMNAAIAIAQQFYNPKTKQFEAKSVGGFGGMMTATGLGIDDIKNMDALPLLGRIGNLSNLPEGQRAQIADLSKIAVEASNRNIVTTGYTKEKTADDALNKAKYHGQAPAQVLAEQLQNQKNALFKDIAAGAAKDKNYASGTTASDQLSVDVQKFDKSVEDMSMAMQSVILKLKANEALLIAGEAGASLFKSSVGVVSGMVTGALGAAGVPGGIAGGAGLLAGGATAAAGVAAILAIIQKLFGGENPGGKSQPPIQGKPVINPATGYYYQGGGGSKGGALPQQQAPYGTPNSLNNPFLAPPAGTNSYDPKGDTVGITGLGPYNQGIATTENTDNPNAPGYTPGDINVAGHFGSEHMGYVFKDGTMIQDFQAGKAGSKPYMGSQGYVMNVDPTGATQELHAHNGIDVNAPMGTVLTSPWTGTISKADFDNYGYGNELSIIGQGKQYKIHFAHLSQTATNPATGKPWAVGDTVTAGTSVLGATGSSGTNSTGAHLHVDVQDVNARSATFGHYVDPLTTEFDQYGDIIAQTAPKGALPGHSLAPGQGGKAIKNAQINPTLPQHVQDQMAAIISSKPDLYNKYFASFTGDQQTNLVNLYPKIKAAANLAGIPEDVLISQVMQETTFRSDGGRMQNIGQFQSGFLKDIQENHGITVPKDWQNNQQWQLNTMAQMDVVDAKDQGSLPAGLSAYTGGDNASGVAKGIAAYNYSGQIGARIGQTSTEWTNPTGQAAPYNTPVTVMPTPGVGGGYGPVPSLFNPVTGQQVPLSNFMGETPLGIDSHGVPYGVSKEKPVPTGGQPVESASMQAMTQTTPTFNMKIAPLTITFVSPNGEKRKATVQPQLIPLSSGIVSPHRPQTVATPQRGHRQG